MSLSRGIGGGTLFKLLTPLFLLLLCGLELVVGVESLINGDCLSAMCKTGLRKVVQDFIAGGKSKSTVVSTYGDIKYWDVSSVTNMRFIFYNSTFNGDLSKWNTKSVTTMQYSKYNKHKKNTVSYI